MMERQYKLRKENAVSFSIDYEKELNSEQLQVVMASPGPLLVLAGAGSGKTRALVFRVARMIESGIAPDRIRLLTFTNRAARNMLDRVSLLCGSKAMEVVGGTFHSVALKDLQRFADRLGYSPQFTVIMRDDVKELMTQLRMENVGQSLLEQFPSSEILIQAISLSLNTQVPIDQVIQEKYRRYYDLSDDIAAVARKFFERKQAMNVMDFDDILLNWYALLREHDEVAVQIQNEIDAVLVDEYQDTNNLQCEIVRYLSQKTQNVTVVGDDAQSIYAFRGASIQNILEFPTKYEGANALSLLTNYRSSPQILKLTNESRKFAKEGFQKSLTPIRDNGEMPAIVSCRDVNMQAEFVAQRILDLGNSGVPFDEVAILYRAHHHAMELQLELMRRKIPFVVRSGLKFFEQAHIKDLLAYLRFAYNLKDEMSFRRAVRIHEGVGPTLAQNLWSELSRHEIRNASSCVEILRSLSLPKRAQLGVKHFCDMLQVLGEPRPAVVLQELFTIHYEEYALSHHANGEQRCDDIRQLILYAKSFQSMERFLGELMLLSEFGVEQLPTSQGSNDEAAKVTLSTIHQAKGLEWAHVFVVWLSEGKFPSELALREENGLEEERRLFYVAATRAKESLYLIHPVVLRSSNWRQSVLRRSRFLEEVTSLKKCDDILAENWVVEHESASEAPMARF